MVTQYMLRTHERKYVFAEKKIKFATILDLIKCFKQIKYYRGCHFELGYNSMINMLCGLYQRTREVTMVLKLFISFVISIHVYIFSTNL